MLTEADLTAVGDFLVTPLRHRPAWSRVSDLEEFLDRAGGITGIGRLRSSLLRVRVGARSRPESLLRLLLEDAGLPTALINPEYRLLSGRVVFPDLAWPDHRVAVEYDGGYHRDADQFVRDIVRTDEMVDEGWHVVHVVAAQLFDRPEEVVERVAQRLASRGAEPISMTRLARFER